MFYLYFILYVQLPPCLIVSPPFYFCPEFSLPRSCTYTSCLSNDHSASYYTNHNNKLSRSVQISHTIFICLYVYIYLCMQAMTQAVWKPEYNLWEWFSPSIKGLLRIALMTLSLVKVSLTSEPCILASNCLCFIWISLAFSTFFYYTLLNDKTIPTCKLWCFVLFFKLEKLCLKFNTFKQSCEFRRIERQLSSGFKEGRKECIWFEKYYDQLG